MNVKRIGLVLGPLFFVLILLFFDAKDLTWAGKATLASTVWIATWWITEAIPISAIALLPIVLFPLTGVMSIKESTSAFASPIVYLFLGGFILAAAIEKTKLHKRIALNIIYVIGVNWSNVILGFMVASAFMSMWISNTATAVMMLPIGLALMSQLDVKDELKNKMGKSLMFAIAYSCSIGGIATIIGTPTNLIFVGVVEETYNVNISFTQWMLIGLPFSVLMLVIGWWYLTKVVFPIKGDALLGGRMAIKEQLNDLGKISYQETAVLVIFFLMAFSWISSSFLLKKIIPNINDTIIAIVGALLLFIVPSGKKNKLGVIDWKTAESIPWGILLLFGGGLAIAKGFDASGLAHWIGEKLVMFEVLPPLLLILAIITAINFLTEITSNVATAAMLMPVMTALALSLDVHPYFLMVSVTLAASCAFMLPVATPPNAVVFSSNLLTIPGMIKVGFWMNIISILLATLLVYYVLPLVWNIDLEVFPQSFR